jgi:hypothetical protein
MNGPAKNIDRPPTPMIVPISPADIPPTRPRKSGRMKLAPKRFIPITKVKAEPTRKLRFRKVRSSTMGLK